MSSASRLWCRHPARALMTTTTTKTNTKTTTAERKTMKKANHNVFHSAPEPNRFGCPGPEHLPIPTEVGKDGSKITNNPGVNESVGLLRW
mmetsp:Transcript_21719/g.51532  ORF Transcript_21719/g.51532 Transcript_21719/m.51532 type:complete len:90 (-) Transcript_21719:445-714(-)